MGFTPHQKVAAEIKARQQEGVELDPTILEVSTHHAKDIWVITLNALVLHVVAQQVHCVMVVNKVIEGGKDEIVQTSYTAAFQPMKHGEDYFWGMADFRYNGRIRRYIMRSESSDAPDYHEQLMDECRTKQSE